MNERIFRIVNVLDRIEEGAALPNPDKPKQRRLSPSSQRTQSKSEVLILRPRIQPFFATLADSLSGRFSSIGYCEKTFFPF
jgi:hypothetical protein